MNMRVRQLWAPVLLTAYVVYMTAWDQVALFVLQRAHRIDA
jgi:hypothetical protein